MSIDHDHPRVSELSATQSVPGDPYFGAVQEPGDESEPGWFDRHATIVISVAVAVIVVAAALVTLFFYRGSMADGDRDTAAAVAEFVQGQGGEVESVHCEDGTCSAIVGGAAYTVLVHEDEDGGQTFGLTAYTGD